MYQGTTPALSMAIKGADVSGMKAFVSFKRGQDILTKSGSDVTMEYDSTNEKTILTVKLTQEETLAMRQGDAIVQCRFIDSNDEAYATDKAVLNVEDVIYKEVISYGGESE